MFDSSLPLQGLRDSVPEFPGKNFFPSARPGERIKGSLSLHPYSYHTVSFALRERIAAEP